MSEPLSEFEERLETLKSRGVVSDALLVQIIRDRISQNRGEIQAIEARQRIRDGFALADAQIRTALELEIMRLNQLWDAS